MTKIAAIVDALIAECTAEYNTSRYWANYEPALLDLGIAERRLRNGSTVGVAKAIKYARETLALCKA